MFFLRLLVLAALAAGFLAQPVSAHSPSHWSTERHLILVASHRLRGDSPTSVVTWLRRQRSVASAAVGRDGHTLSVQFRSGLNAAVLPDSKSAAVPVPMFSRHVEVRTGPSATRPRALVLEPFATSLNLGPNAGAIEADDLQSAGYQVDQLRDSAVTIGTMETLANYNVVYMVTHSGVNQWGEGVVSTGEVANNDPSIESMVKEFSVLIVGVAGSDQLYYGIMSRFVQYHVGQFPSHSIMFINGCSMLSASLFWKALANKGVGAMISWDHDALAMDDVSTADDFFSAMYRGKDIADAATAVRADGLGVSRPENQPVANFGYLGDGTITLATAARATPTTTSTPVTGTPTPVKIRKPHVTLLKHVLPGQQQRVSIVDAPGVFLRLTLIYPDGTRHTLQRSSGSAGKLTYAYTQPSSVITPSSTVARVIVTDLQSHGSATATYSISAGRFDLHIAPRRVGPGQRVIFSVYSQRGGHGQIDIVRGGRLVHRMLVRLSAGHWARASYVVPRSLAHTQLEVNATLVGIGAVRQPLLVT